MNRAQHEADVALQEQQRSARDREALDRQTAQEVARINKAKQARIEQFRKWDALLAADEFQNYLVDRGLTIRKAWEPLPYDEGAEMTVIGAMLFDPSTVHIAIGPLRPVHFHQRDAGDALCAVASLVQQQRQGKTAPVDIVTVCSEMRRQKTFIPATPDFLKDCMEICPGSENMAAYVESVMSAARLRFQHWLGDMLTHKPLEAQADAALLANATRRALDAIETRGMVNLNEIFEDTK